MNERAFNAAKGRELGRLHRSVDRAIDELQAARFDETRDYVAYRQYVATANFVRNLLRGTDLLADKALPLFARQGERSNWEVYLSGLRKLFRDLPDSYLFRFVLPMYGLEEFQEKMAAYAGRWLEGLHAAHTFFADTQTYLGHLERGDAIAEEYQASADDLVRLYASLKTWESDAEVERYVANAGEFVESTFEVIVVGPIQLYLMLGRDSFLLLFKTLSVGRLSDLREGEAEFAEILSLHDYAHEQVEHSTTLALLREVSGRAAKFYAQSLRDDSLRLRAQVPNRDLRRAFVNRYEAGVLFRQAST